MELNGKKMYHLTRATNKDSILEKGILKSDLEDCVYLAPTLEGALNFSIRAMNELVGMTRQIQIGQETIQYPEIKIHDELIVFCVDCDLMNPNLFEESSDHSEEFFQTKAYRYYGDIEPSTIDKVYAYTVSKGEVSQIDFSISN